MNDMANSNPSLTKLIASASNAAMHIARDVYGKFLGWLKARKEHHTDRAAILELLDLDNTQLNDIGITRADVIWASKLPIGTKASDELQKIARNNRN